VYAKWGWGTEDGAQALSYLKRFGSVTVLNGHIHQTMKKVEGNVSFHTARSTAFPQGEPGKAESPGPIKNVPPKSPFGYRGPRRACRAGGHDLGPNASLFGHIRYSLDR
jgi:3',5'-cyclic-AMP phosphodiesterase